MDHVEGTVVVFESKITTRARVHARTLQISTGPPPYVPYNALMLNMCPIETMNIIVLLTDKWHYDMAVPLVCTIHGAHLIIHIMSLRSFRPNIK